MNPRAQIQIQRDLNQKLILKSPYRKRNARIPVGPTSKSKKHQMKKTSVTVEKVLENAKRRKKEIERKTRNGSLMITAATHVKMTEEIRNS